MNVSVIHSGCLNEVMSNKQINIKKTLLFNNHFYLRCCFSVWGLARVDYILLGPSHSFMWMNEPLTLAGLMDLKRIWSQVTAQSLGRDFKMRPQSRLQRLVYRLFSLWFSFRCALFIFFPCTQFGVDVFTLLVLQKSLSSAVLCAN